MKNIRNFCIIAHIDHGKSTLADRLLQVTGTISDRELQNQTLDDMDLERERGITIKSHAIQMEYEKDGEKYILNLIDTPGHVDFSYEVSRSIAACEGALLIVDAAQSIQAQTISNLYLALENDLEIIPVLNKIDLPSANPEEVTDDIVDLLGCAPEDVLRCSGKTGEGVLELLHTIIEKVPAPVGDPDAPLQALIFDSVYNPFRGIEAFYKVVNGQIKKGDQVKFMATNKKYGADEIGTLKLNQVEKPIIKTGDVGYIISGIKEASEVKVGDTITLVDNPAAEAIDGFEEVKPMVFAGIYPVDTEDYEDLRASIEKLRLNDASLTFEAESSAALGFGFRCGFLGMLHLEIIQERLEREFNLDLVTTAPGVIYKVHKTNGEVFDLTNPSNLPDPSEIEYMEEPFVSAEIMVTSEYVGAIMKLCQERRGIYISMDYIEATRAVIKYDMPLNEIIYDFFDALKSRSRGYASFDYEMKGYVRSDLVKLDILINKEMVDALSFIVFKDSAYDRGRKMCERLKEEIPRHLFEIPIQAAVNGKVIARETVKAMRKDVLAKCYGGDISRKKKLLEKQKEGKKRMRQVGSVEVPQEAFMSVLKLDED